MSRADNYRATIESPVKKYLSWSSTEKCFKYYDKEQAKEVLLKLPLTFVHLDEFATIKGWDDDNKSSIYSNEVRSTKLEQFNVRSKGGEIVKGIYQDIKLRIQAANAYYCVSVYVYLNGEIVNLSFKKSSLKAWSDFTKDNRKLFFGSTIEILTTLEDKNGAVKYYTPVFTLGKPIAITESEKAEEAYTELKTYLDARKVQPELPVESVVTDNRALHNLVSEFPVLEATTIDDLPF